MWKALNCCSHTKMWNSEDQWHKVYIFKQSKVSLNSGSLFSKIGCLIKAKEIGLLYYLPKAERRLDGFMPYPGFEPESLIPFPMTIPVILSEPLKSHHQHLLHPTLKKKQPSKMVLGFYFTETWTMWKNLPWL